MTRPAAEELSVEVLDRLDDHALTSEWDRVLATGSTDTVFLTLAWQREWWNAFGGDRLLVAVARSADRIRTIVPMFTLEDMLFFVGSGGSDYLDIIGEADAQTLARMLAAAREEMGEFAGIALYHVPRQSRTTALLPAVAQALDLELFEEGTMTAPYLDLTNTDTIAGIVGSRKRRKSEARMQRVAPICIRQAREEELDEWLDAFFLQHTTRWLEAGEEGIAREDAREFYRRIVHEGHRLGWLRFTRLQWGERPAAFEIALRRRATHLAYLVSRDPSIIEYSPGKILERHVLLGAPEDGIRRYDYGLGDEPYKARHASGFTEVVNWTLYP